MKNKMTSERLEAFSDGVLAIIITIMVLELEAPKEYTLEAVSRVTKLEYSQQGDLTLVELDIKGNSYLVAINKAQTSAKNTFNYQNKEFTLNGRLGVYMMNNNQE